MINLRDHEESLRKLGREYFINELRFETDVASWARENNKDLSEPHNPMKLVVSSGDEFAMVIQEKIDDNMLADVIKNLSIKWSVKDNATDIEKKFNTDKKRLSYCFLKEYATALDKTDGDELAGIEWVMEELEYLGFFQE